MRAPRIIVLAKAPVPGLVKTRLCPPCTEQEAAEIADAALRDTLDAVTSVPGSSPTLVLDGAPGDWVPSGCRVVAQRGSSHAERIGNAFLDVGGPSLLIGMDTPQVTSRLLADCIDALMSPRTDAVLGAADDGGWWALGLRRPIHGAFDGVPMSTSATGAHQRRRLDELGLRTTSLAMLRDVDTVEDAIAVADAAPHTRFGSAVKALLSVRIDP